MKKLLIAMTLGATSLALQSCGGSNQANDSTDTTTMATDTTMTMGDTTTMAVDQMDIDFANKAAVGGMAEVELGKLAQEKGTNGKVKDFATMMVKDHGMANEELMSITKSKGITLPTTLDEEHAKKKTELSAKSGAEFDRAYVAAMVEGHEKTLSLMEDGSKNCKDSDLKAFAAKTAPVVKSHLDMIKKIQSEMK